MATDTILSGAKPDTSGEVYRDAFENHATNDRWKGEVVAFEDGSTKTGLSGHITIRDLTGFTAVSLDIYWTSATTSGDVEWDLEYRCVGGDDTESLDQTSQQEAVNSNDTAPSAAFERQKISISLTFSNFAAGDTFQFDLSRDKTDAGDTLADEALVFDAVLNWS